MSLIAWSISSEYQCKGTCINSAFACAKGLKTKPDHFSEKSLSNALTTPIVYSLASDHIAFQPLQVYFQQQSTIPDSAITNRILIFRSSHNSIYFKNITAFKTSFT